MLNKFSKKKIDALLFEIVSKTKEIENTLYQRLEEIPLDIIVPLDSIKYATTSIEIKLNELPI